MCLAAVRCPGESQCSYVLGDEHLEVRCGVVDPARRGASIAVAVDSSSDDSDSSEDSEDSSSSSEDSSDASSDDSAGSSSSEEDEEESGSSISTSSDGGKKTSPQDGAHKEAGEENTPAAREGPDAIIPESIPAGTDCRLDVDNGTDCVTPKGDTKSAQNRVDVDLTDTTPKTNQTQKPPVDLTGTACSEKQLNATPTAPNRAKPVQPPVKRDRKTGTGSEAGRSEDVAARQPAVPAGIPARGPAVLYRCRVLHDEGSTFLVISCPNIGYVSAVRNHAIVKGARRDNR